MDADTLLLQLARARAMQAAYRQRVLKNPREDAPSAQEIKTLGLLPDQKPEDVNMKPLSFLPHIKPSIG